MVLIEQVKQRIGFGSCDRSVELEINMELKTTVLAVERGSGSSYVICLV